MKLAKPSMQQLGAVVAVPTAVVIGSAPASAQELANAAATQGALIGNVNTWGAVAVAVAVALVGFGIIIAMVRRSRG